MDLLVVMLMEMVTFGSDCPVLVQELNGGGGERRREKERELVHKFMVLKFDMESTLKVKETIFLSLEK